MLFYGSKHYIVDFKQQVYAQFVCFVLKSKDPTFSFRGEAGSGQLFSDGKASVSLISKDWLVCLFVLRS